MGQPAQTSARQNLSTYVSEQAQLAWDRTLAFVRERLTEPPR